MLGPATRLRAWRHLFRRIGEPMVWPSVGAALRGSTRCEGRMETREHGTPDVVPVGSMATPAHRAIVDQSRWARPRCVPTRRAPRNFGAMRPSVLEARRPVAGNDPLPLDRRRQV